MERIFSEFRAYFIPKLHILRVLQVICIFQNFQFQAGKKWVKQFRRPYMKYMKTSIFQFHFYESNFFFKDLPLAL